MIPGGSRRKPPAPVPGSIGAPLAVPQHLQERLTIPEEDEEDMEIERETQTTTSYRNDGSRWGKGQCESASQPAQSTSLGTKSDPLRLGHHLGEGLEQYGSNQ